LGRVVITAAHCLPFLPQALSVGYKLANDGHDTRSIQGYLGHRSIVSTQRYTALAPDRFKRF
jgi:site-specific recombinase XerD